MQQTGYLELSKLIVLSIQIIFIFLTQSGAGYSDDLNSTGRDRSAFKFLVRWA